MEAGKLNHQITIQKKAIVKDADGYPSKTWVDLDPVWANVITTGGGEFYAAQRLNAETSAVFKVRYTEKINVRQRIKYGNRIFEILATADPDGKRIEINISAKEVVTSG